MVEVVQSVKPQPVILKGVHYGSKVAGIAVVIHHDGFPGLEALRDATGERGFQLSRSIPGGD